MGLLTGIRDILIGVFGLGIMIFVHELGHLIAAKLLRVKVEKFSIGYGKKLVGFTRGGTTYQIALFPFGGFTKMKGEHVFARAVQENLDRLPDDPDNYYHQAPWKRVIIALAGPVFNILFAILFFTVLYWAGFNEYSYGNRVILTSDLAARPPAEPNPADAAGIKTGDRIIAVNGRETRHFGEIRRELAFSPDRPASVTVQRENGAIERLTVTPRLNRDSASGVIGVTDYADPVVQSVSPKTAELNSWLIPGVRITAVDGRPVKSNYDVLAAFKNKPESLPMTIEMNGKTITRDFHPQYIDGDFQPLGIGFAVQPFRTPRYNIVQAFIRGLDEFSLNAYSIVYFISLLPKRINVGNVIGGPLQTTVTIVQYTASGLDRGLDQGLVQFIQLLCMLSTILALMNLLPLPVLDGGFIILFIIEWLRRKPFRPRFIFRFQMVGVGLLGLLFIVVMFNDIFRLFSP